MTNTTLLIGGTGKTGRRVAERLTALDVDVRIGSRRTTPRFDWDDESTWLPALDGVTAAYVTFYPRTTAYGTWSFCPVVARRWRRPPSGRSRRPAPGGPS
jgi:hypothetical protein